VDPKRGIGKNGRPRRRRGTKCRWPHPPTYTRNLSVNYGRNWFIKLAPAPRTPSHPDPWPAAPSTPCDRGTEWLHRLCKSFDLRQKMFTFVKIFWATSKYFDLHQNILTCTKIFWPTSKYFDLHQNIWPTPKYLTYIHHDFLTYAINFLIYTKNTKKTRVWIPPGLQFLGNHSNAVVTVELKCNVCVIYNEK
jgi:hypothetical protein